MDKLAELSLPPKEAFYSRLNDEETTNEDYEHAKTVWKEFRIRTLREYTSLYNRVDVLQLADIFENFRNICLENYKLDPAWYFTLPGLAWDAMLKRTGISSELLTDVDKLLMFKNGIRGGVATSSNRFEALTTDIWVKLTTVVNLQNIYNTLMLTTFMVGLCRNHYLHMDSSG